MYQKLKKFIPSLTITLALLAGAAIAASDPATIQLPDGVFRANLYDKSARLEIRNGQPVSYNWGARFTAEKVWLEGNIINIDNATLTTLSANENRIIGDWKYGDYFTKNVHFFRSMK